MNRRVIGGAAVAAALLGISVRSASAQAPVAGTITPAQLDSALKAAADVRKQTVAANMILTPEEAKAFWPLYDNYRAEVAAVRTKEFKTLHQLVLAGDKLTDANANAIMNMWLSLQMQEQKLRAAYFPKFSKVLAPKKVARYFQVEHRLDLFVQMAVAQEIPLVY